MLSERKKLESSFAIVEDAACGGGVHDAIWSASFSGERWTTAILGSRHRAATLKPLDFLLRDSCDELCNVSEN